MQGDVQLRGHLDVLLLAILSAGPAHGYAIIEDLRRRSGGAFDLPEGTVYPALHRLEDEGLLTSDWSADRSRRRRVYALTRPGHARLRARCDAWREIAGAIEAVLEGAVWPASA
jgi:PadR family transcriptional regulator, regulatory protein PadR